MAGGELGRWEPLRLAAAVKPFKGAPFRWWVSGGIALELQLGQSWRDHDDIDVVVTGGAVPAIRSVFAGWGPSGRCGGALDGRLVARAADLLDEAGQRSQWVCDPEGASERSTSNEAALLAARHGPKPMLDA